MLSALGGLILVERLPGLQVARAVAALGVVYFHSWVALVRFPEGTASPIAVLRDYGFLGVDLFFAISGFVICIVVTRPNFSVAVFLTKRVFRLYPIWMIALTTFALLAWVWRGLSAERNETLGYFLWSATLLPTEKFPFYDLGWTLQHEMAFYLSAAIVVPLFGIYGLIAFLTTTALIAHLFELPWYLSKLAHYHPWFLAGVLAFVARPRLAQFGPLIPLAIGLGTTWFLMAVWGERPCEPIALFFLVIGFANIRDSKSRLMAGGTALGDASYSIYLIHPLVFLIASALVSKLLPPVWLQEPIRAGCILAVICVSLLSWRYIERPMIQIGNQIASKRKPIIGKIVMLSRFKRAAHGNDGAVRNERDGRINKTVAGEGSPAHPSDR